MKKNPYANSYIRAVIWPRSPWEIKGAIALRDDFEKDAYVVDGVPFWKSNNVVPPQDILDFWAYCGLPIDLAKAEAARDAQTTAHLTAYREAMKNHVPDAEELYEMRAAFGPGETVVNIITGQRYTT